MQRLIVLLPHLISDPEQESFLRQKLPDLERLSEASTIFELLPVEGGVTPEATLLGLSPGLVELADGPLTCSWLGVDPPDRSVQFHVSLLHLDEEGILHRIEVDEEIAPVLSRLDRPRWTFVPGRGPDHALVWEEGSLELGAHAPFEGMDYRTHRPEGDGETVLRSWIEDSVDLLGNHPLNREREDKGLLRVNIGWPWGPGFRNTVPNLPLRRGRLAKIITASRRLWGLSRLAGYRLGDPSILGPGLAPQWDRLATEMATEECLVVHVQAFERIQREERVDLGARWWEQFSERCVRTLLERPADEPFELWILAPGGKVSENPGPARASNEGLGLRYRSATPGSSTIPFDERALGDGRLKKLALWEVLDSALGGS